MRQAAIVSGNEIVNVIVIPDGPKGDEFLSEDCIEITGMNPKPGIGTGWSFVDGAFIPPTFVVTWEEVRAKRDFLLAESDWTQMPDSPLSSEEKFLWSDYRQLLRNLPQQFAKPEDVVWPEAP